MSDSNLFSLVHESLTKPIRERPVASLIFFAALLAVGAWLTRWLQGRPDLWREALIALLLVLPSVGIILCLHRLVVMRDQPPSLKDPAVLEGIKKSFVGRDEDAEALVALMLTSHQVWLNGDSGVGKSVLLQKAVLPELARRKIAFICLNSWHGDWEESPAKAILGCLNIFNLDGDSVLAALHDALESVRELVIVLDQFDEFQIEHRDRFIPGHGQVISRSQLEEHNKFFHILNAAIRRGRVCCVFVTRRDVEWGKRVVLFEEADEFFLKRLPKSVVEAEIGRVLPIGTVVNANNGWDELREQLCNDLGDDGILPVQMRFVVLGLEELRHDLTCPAYFRIGRVNGLISRYIEREVRRVAGDKSLSVLLFSLLNQMVSADGKSTVPGSEEELLWPIPEYSKDSVLHTLEELERRDIVRRVLSQEGSVLWRLDHDYLAGPVREIARRQIPEQWELKERYERFVASLAWQKPLRLAGLLTIVRLTHARAFRGLRFGSAAAWFMFSISAWLAISASIVYASFDVVARVRSQQTGRRLLSALELGHEGVAPRTADTRDRNRSSDLSLGNREAKALLQLSEADTLTRRAFLETGLDSSENARQVLAYSNRVAIALSRMDPSESLRLYEDVLHPIFMRPKTDAIILGASCELLGFWGGVSLLKQSEAERLASMLVDRMAHETDVRALHEMASCLGMFKSIVSPEMMEAAASRLVDRMAVETSWLVRSDLTSGLYALPGQVRPPLANKLAARLVETMSQETDTMAITELAFSLSTLKDQIDPAKIEAAASKVVEQMTVEKSDFYLSSAASCLGALTNRVGQTKVEELAWNLMGRISKERTANALKALANGLAALKDKIGPQTAEQLALELVRRMAIEADFDRLDATASGLAAIKERISLKTIESRVTNLAQRINKETDPNMLATLASSLGTLKNAAGSRTAGQLASELVDRMTKLTDSKAILRSSGSLRRLKDNIIEPTVAKSCATRLTERITRETNSSVLINLVWRLGEIQNKVEVDARKQLTSKLVDRISNEANTSNVPILAYGIALSLPEGSLFPTDVERLSVVFQMPNAPCNIVLLLDRDARRSQLIRQLANPICTQHSWKLLALEAAQFTGRPIAQGDKDKPDKIIVNFPELCSFVARDRPRLSRSALGVPTIVSLVLLLGAAVSCVCAMARLRPAALPAPLPSQV